MAILMVLDVHGATTDDYDRLNGTMGIDPGNLPDGLISHAVGPAGDGLLIVDTWESEEALERFFEDRAGPGMQEVGIGAGAQPRVFPVHNEIRQGAGTDPGVIIVIESPGFHPDGYDRVTGDMDAHAGDGSDHPAVSHTAAVTDDGMIFVDIWPSTEAFEQFAASQLADAGDELGPIEPRVVPVHNRMVAS
jgi:hypothetical protein